ncbi:hypothetical protein [Litchfieldia alkalitelluris]|uniref:hypothetical protein n=1 Tax=Litchfieldia alkalitelluris TaxID=304268 RepID=UPI001957E130|nr:hypothetical protein [Litchfieldia alkalitelluris]
MINKDKGAKWNSIHFAFLLVHKAAGFLVLLSFGSHSILWFCRFGRILFCLRRIRALTRRIFHYSRPIFGALSFGFVDLAGFSSVSAAFGR